MRVSLANNVFHDCLAFSYALYSMLKKVSRRGAEIAEEKNSDYHQ